MNINVNDLIRNILNKSNSIVDCLPYHIQDNIRNVISYIKNFAFEQGLNNDYNDFFYNGKLDRESLYIILNSISKDLGICNLLFPNNVYLEDAAHNIGIIISFIGNNDYIFLSNRVKRKIK